MRQHVAQVYAWVEQRLPTEQEPRWRAQMLFSFLLINLLALSLPIVLVLVYDADPALKLLTVLFVALLVGILVMVLWYRLWREGALVFVTLFTTICFLAEYIEPGPTAISSSFILFNVSLTGLLVGGRAAIIVALILSGAICSDIQVPDANSLLFKSQLGALIGSVVLPLATAALIWAMERHQVAGFRELKRAREDAEAGARAKSAFLATMSHEIRTPLNGVLGLTQLLQRTELSADQATLLTTLRSSGEALQHVLNDVLDYSRLEGGHISLEEQPFSPKQLSEEIISLFSPRAQEKSLRLYQEVHPEIPEALLGDPFRLRQVLLNLVGNALKFTTSGEVRLHVQPDGPQQIQFAVADTGIGIPADRLDALFEPFVQADASTKRRFGGTGLGLTISRRLVEAMGGTLTVTSVVDEGTTFTIRLPLQEAIATLSTLAGPSAFYPLQGRILVAEDNAINQLVIKRMLRGWSIDVDIVEDGQHAVEAATRTRYDLILMDQFMPEMDGREATRHLREAGYTLPILALTASVSPEEQAACLAAGMDKVISKPIDERILFAVLSHYLLAAEEAQTTPNRAEAYNHNVDFLVDRPDPVENTEAQRTLNRR
ncbi:MAG: ATP-binding protein [Myxococcota bacterium]